MTSPFAAPPPAANPQNLELGSLVANHAVALGLGLVIAGIHWFTARGRARSDNPSTTGLMATLVMLTVLICMISTVINDSIARAFSLVGALAIVRFRTVVEDTRDTAFVIFSVGAGMAVATGHTLVVLVCLPFAAAAAMIFRGDAPANPAPHAGAFTLTLRVGTAYSSAAAMERLAGEHLSSMDLLGVATARQGSAFERTYEVRLKPGADPTALVSALNATEGVQGVEIRRA